MNPGGYLEVIDIAFPVYSDDNMLPPNSSFLEWSQMIADGWGEIGWSVTTTLSYVS
jgi:hypothetical protein